VEAEDIRSQFLDNPASLMTKDAAAGHGREVTLQNVKVCPADGGRSDPNDGVRCLHNRRLGPIFPGPATPRYATLSWLHLPSPDEGPYDQWMRSYSEIQHGLQELP